MFHELYHVDDYYKFSKVILNDSFEGIYKHPYFESYRMWSEFHSFSYADYYALQYMDYISESNDSHQLISKYNDNLYNYVERMRTRMQHKQFTSYNLSVFLVIYIVGRSIIKRQIRLYMQKHI